MKKITVSAPGKLVLLGEHAVVYNRPCLVTAMDSRIYVTIEKISESKLIIDAPDVGVQNYRKDIKNIGKGEIKKEIQFVEIAVKNFSEKYSLTSGIHMTTSSQFSSKLGFGSSSAVSVAGIKALSEVFEKNLTNKEIFDLSYKTILDIQKKGSGVDVAAAVYGGIVYFVTGGKVIEKLSVPNFDFVVGYSGEKVDTVIQINKVKKEAEKNPQKIESIYNQIEQLVIKAKEALLKNNMSLFGDLMSKNHMLLQQLGVSNNQLDKMIHAAVSDGAYGAKLSGGGGDCMIAVCPKEKKETVVLAIQRVGGEIIPVLPTTKGVIIEQ